VERSYGTVHWTFSLLKYGLFKGRCMQCECKLAQRSFRICVSCCLQMIVRPPGCSNSVFGSVSDEPAATVFRMGVGGKSAWCL